MFDVFEFPIFQQFMEFDEDPQTFMHQQMIDIGYESHNALQNLGTVAAFVLLYLVRIFIFVVLVLLSIKYKLFVPFKNNLKRNLFFSEILTIFLEAYIEFLISGCLSYQYHIKLPLTGEYIS